MDGLQAGNQSGTGVYTNRLIRWLPEVAEDLDLAVLWPRGVRPPEDRAVEFIPVRVSGVTDRLLLSQYTLPKLRRRGKADLAHYTSTVGSLLYAPETVVTVHDLSFFRHPEWFRRERAWYYRWATVLSVRPARRVIADSEATSLDLQAFLDIPESRIDVVPLGVDEWLAPADLGEIARARQEYGLPERYFLYLGTLEPRKNLPALVRAWSSVAEHLPQDLVLAGRWGWHAKALRGAVAASPHRSRIHFPGFIASEDLAAVLSGADGFVWPSLWEGFGLPPLEAMACGTPVVTSSTSSLPEVVGEAAILVSPEDEEAIAHALVRLVTDHALCQSLREAGLARASQFTWRRTAALTASSYRRAIEG